ncbi:hypothetical protein C8R48DRAFT_670961 [Suillus tomentosus]|nr:hypothetical protein C8R48DRAFT_670961 [Suillus tomentosus]
MDLTGSPFLSLEDPICRIDHRERFVRIRRWCARIIIYSPLVLCLFDLITKLGKMLWENALLDAQKVTELNPSSHILTHAVLHGAQHYDEAIEAFKIMLSKLDDSLEARMQDDSSVQHLTPRSKLFSLNCECYP